MEGLTKEKLIEEMDNMEFLLQNKDSFSAKTLEKRDNTLDHNKIDAELGLKMQNSKDMTLQRSYSLKYKNKANTKKEFALLISGASLNLLFGDEELSKRITKVFQMAASIVVYRSSPDDKAQTVKFIMKTNPGCYTLAVGDGANDVNMI